MLGTFVEDPEQLLRNIRCYKVSPQRFISNLNPFQEGSSVPPPKESMVQKLIATFLALSAADVAMGHQFNLGMPLLSLNLCLSTWCKPNRFAGSLMRTLMPTINTSWRCVAPSLSRV
jgi:hypothetical protein